MVSIRLSMLASRLEPFDPDHARLCGDMTVLIDMSERCAHGGFERVVGNEGKGSSRAFLSGRALDDALDRHLLVCKSSGDGCNRARPVIELERNIIAAFMRPHRRAPVAREVPRRNTEGGPEVAAGNIDDIA